MKLALLLYSEKTLNYCNFLSYRRYLVLHELKSIFNLKSFIFLILYCMHYKK